MARLAAVLTVCLLASACTTAPATPSAFARALPSRAVLRAAFERLGAKFQQRTASDGTTILDATNSVRVANDREFNDVSIYGDLVRAASVNLPAVTIDSAGRFPGSALVDVMDSFDPGVKRWFVDQMRAESADPRLEGLESEIALNGLVAQILPIRLPRITVLVVETSPVASPSN